MPQYKNETNVSLPMAVWLATDTYDHNDDPFTISATSLLKSPRQMVLARRLKPADVPVELSSLVASKMGTAIHEGVEHAWVHNYKQAMKDLGYPKGAINSVLVNPEPEELFDGCIPVYLEKRSSKKVGKYTVSGKFDFVFDGRIDDVKSTGVFTFQNKTNDEKYIQQGSIYRWLNPDIVTSDVMAIQYIFTDWQAMRAKGNDPTYPKTRLHEEILNLYTVKQTEAFVARKIRLLDELEHTPEPELPLCNDEELWRKAPSWKYYKNPEKMSRSTKNFDNQLEAEQRFIADKGVGVIVQTGGEVVACKYCNVASVCTQRLALIEDGSLKV